MSHVCCDGGGGGDGGVGRSHATKTQLSITRGRPKLVSTRCRSFEAFHVHPNTRFSPTDVKALALVLCLSSGGCCTREAVLDANEVEVEMTSLKARAAALEEDKKALEAELPHLRGEDITSRHDCACSYRKSFARDRPHSVRLGWFEESPRARV